MVFRVKRNTRQTDGEPVGGRGWPDLQPWPVCIGKCCPRHIRRNITEKIDRIGSASAVVSSYTHRSIQGGSLSQNILHEAERRNQDKKYNFSHTMAVYRGLDIA